MITLSLEALVGIGVALLALMLMHLRILAVERGARAESEYRTREEFRATRGQADSQTTTRLQEMEAQYQARLAQADRLIEHKEILIEQLRTENKGLLDRCLARNNYTPIHNKPNAVPPTPRVDINSFNPAVRAQDVAASKFADFLAANAVNPPPNEGE